MKKIERLKDFFKNIKAFKIIMTGKKKWISIGIIAVLIIGVFFLKSHQKQKALEAEMQAPPPPTAFVERGDVQRLIYASGTIREDAGEEIRPGVNAKVTSVLVTEGQQVKVEDPLFTLDNTEISLEYTKEKLNYETQLRELQEEITALQGSEIRSTESGTISKILVENETEIMAGTVVAKLTKSESFNLKAGFNGADIEYIKEGQSAQVFLQDFLSYLPGKVTRVNHRGQTTPEGGLLYMVTIEIKNPGALREGNMARAEIDTGNKTVRSIGLNELSHLDEVDLKAGYQGKVNHISVKEGDEINVGDLILTVDSQDQRTTLKEKQLAMEQARLNMELKQKEYDKYQAKASVDGTVVELNVESGKDCPLDKPAVVIAAMTSLKMTVRVDEIDIPFVQIGQKADVYANAYGDRKFSGVVSRVAQKGKLDGSTVYFEAELTIEDPGPLKPGMTGDADIMAEHKSNVLRLPAAAVTIEDTGNGTVFIKGEGDAPPEPRPVKIGIEGDDFVEIIEGLKEGDEVLLNGMSSVGIPMQHSFG